MVGWKDGWINCLLLGTRVIVKSFRIKVFNQQLRSCRCSNSLCSSFLLKHLHEVIHLLRLFLKLAFFCTSKVDTPSRSARELALAAARLDAHLYWSISSRLDEEPTLTEQAAKQADGGSANSKGGEPMFTVGEMTDIQEQSGPGELNGSVATDQSESEA